MKNAVHGSSDVEKAEKVIKEFLPEVEILPDGTVRGLDFLYLYTFSIAHLFVFLGSLRFLFRFFIACSLIFLTVSLLLKQTSNETLKRWMLLDEKSSECLKKSSAFYFAAGIVLTM